MKISNINFQWAIRRWLKYIRCIALFVQKCVRQDLPFTLLCEFGSATVCHYQLHIVSEKILETYSCFVFTYVSWVVRIKGVREILKNSFENYKINGSKNGEILKLIHFVEIFKVKSEKNWLLAGDLWNFYEIYKHVKYSATMRFPVLRFEG